MTIGKRILSVLQAKSLTQKALAEFIGVSGSTLNNYLQLDRRIPADYVIPICEFLDVAPGFLLAGKENEKIPASAELSEDEAKVLKYYQELDDTDKDDIRGQLAHLYKETLAKREGAASQAEVAV